MPEDTELQFTKASHFWLDSGLLGLYRTLDSQASEESVALSKDEGGFAIRGDQKDIVQALERAYDALIADYYDVSTQKQKDDLKGHNFFYDSEAHRFKTFPKKKSQGIASLIFDKAVRPQYPEKQIRWANKTPGRLPSSHVELQVKLDKFLADSGLKPGPPAGMLVDGPNRVCPKVAFPKKLGASRGQCFLCGQAAERLEEAKETVFPLITGKSGVLSFNSGVENPEKVCWKCAFLGKFVPVNGFFQRQGDHLFCFFPYSSDFLKMLEVYPLLHEAEYDDPNRYRNFDHPLGGYFQKPFELTFAFLYTIYGKVLQRRIAEEETELDFEKLFSVVLRRAPLVFYVMAAAMKGKTWMTTFTWAFDDAVYFFRLMDDLERSGIKTKEAMRLLIDFDKSKNEDKTLLRERVCEGILKKQTILSLVEQHCFHICMSKSQFIRPLFEMVLAYEPLVRKENQMTPEEQEVAVNLGKQLGHRLGAEQKKKRSGKGDLFRLRKVRKKVDFLNELERLLQKYSDLKISKAVFEGKLNDDNFTEFKHFCALSALNTFNAVTSPSTGVSAAD